MSSSLRNAVKRKTHKERAQPAGRKKLGLLEKTKDYRLRAADFHRKKAALDTLRRKADLRNEDEFYFGMVNGETREGVHVMKREGPDSLAQRLSETFDSNYLQQKLAHEKNMLTRLQSSLHLVGLNDSKLTVFVDDDDESEQPEEDDASHLPQQVPSRKMAQRTDKGYAELLRRKERVQALEKALSYLELKHNLQKKGKRFKVADGDGDAPARFVWASERAR
jgi:U3 small nucleolar RNA-associated protein 11